MNLPPSRSGSNDAQCDYRHKVLNTPNARHNAQEGQSYHPSPLTVRTQLNSMVPVARMNPVSVQNPHGYAPYPYFCPPAVLPGYYPQQIILGQSPIIYAGQQYSNDSNFMQHIPYQFGFFSGYYPQDGILRKENGDATNEQRNVPNMGESHVDVAIRERPTPSRDEMLKRYREKRKRRTFNRVIYSARKQIATKRPRIAGRFVKQEKEPKGGCA